MKCKRCAKSGRKCPALDPDWEGHGYHWAYKTHSCRCDLCTDANAVYMRKWRKDHRTMSRSEAALERESYLTEEERRERALRGWETRRGNREMRA